MKKNSKIGPRQGSNQGPSDPKASVVTTRPKIHWNFFRKYAWCVWAVGILMSGKFEIQSLEKFNSLKQSQCDSKSTKSCQNLFGIPKAKSGSIPIKIRQPF